MLRTRLRFLKYALLFLVTFTVSLLVELSVYTEWPRYRGLFPENDQNEDLKDQFLDDWCRLQNWTFDWEGFLAPCNEQLAWHQRQVNSAQRSDAHRSFIKKWSLKPAGQFSRFFIQSVTSHGQPKTFGGDSWRVYIRQGPSSLAPVVYDLNNGLYEVLFLILEAGSYNAQVWLDYTLCDGVREPPHDWFIKGNAQGKSQKDGTLGYIGDDYLRKPLWSGGKNITFTISPPESNKLGIYKYKTSLKDMSCSRKCPLVWNGLGRWVSGQWNSYINENKTVEDARKEDTNKRLGTLQGFGDSVGLQFYYQSVVEPICADIFSNCNNTYRWVYDTSNIWDDDQDFNQTNVLEAIKQDLTKPDMLSTKSVFLFNLGVHFPISLSFVSYKKLIDSVIKMLLETRTDFKGGYSKKFPSIPIWRSFTAIEQEFLGVKYGAHNLTEFRFHTKPRNQLFHKYSMYAMCKAGIPSLDMYQLSFAWPTGTWQQDHVHYAYDVFLPGVNALERYIRINYLSNDPSKN